jgi:hypothetical protein
MYVEGEESMYEAVHAMRTRIITSPAFTGEKILGAILFENTSTFYYIFWNMVATKRRLFRNSNLTVYHTLQFFLFHTNSGSTN